MAYVQLPKRIDIVPLEDFKEKEVPFQRWKDSRSIEFPWKSVDKPLKGADIVAKAARLSAKINKKFVLLECCENIHIVLRFLMSMSFLEQGVLELHNPLNWQMTAVKMRDFSRNLLGFISLSGAPAILLNKSLSLIPGQLDKGAKFLEKTGAGRVCLKALQVFGKGLGTYSGFFCEVAIPRGLQFMRIATFAATIEIFYKLSQIKEITWHDLGVHCVEITQAGAELMLVVIKITGVLTGVSLYVEGFAIALASGLFIYEIVGYVKPEKKLAKLV